MVEVLNQILRLQFPRHESSATSGNSYQTMHRSGPVSSSGRFQTASCVNSRTEVGDNGGQHSKFLKGRKSAALQARGLSARFDNHPESLVPSIYSGSKCSPSASSAFQRLALLFPSSAISSIPLVSSRQSAGSSSSFARNKSFPKENEASSRLSRAVTCKLGAHSTFLDGSSHSKALPNAGRRSSSSCKCQPTSRPSSIVGAVSEAASVVTTTEYEERTQTAVFQQKTTYDEETMKISLAPDVAMSFTIPPPVDLSEEDVGLGPLKELERTPMIDEAWKLLQGAVVTYCGQPVGTLAACDPTDITPLNYDQVFIRDFIPSAVSFLLSGQHEIVRNFLLHTLQLQSWEKSVDCFTPGEGLMPASFKVRQVPVENEEGLWEEHLDPDFGESAIGRVAPVDSGLWWIMLLRAYGKATGDRSLERRVDFQTGIKLILKVCLADHFDMFPTLITTDGPCMIDRRLGIHGHPLEIQSLFFGALRAARDMIAPENGGIELIRAVNARLTALSFHIQEYYWIDLAKINQIYRYKTEEYSQDAINKFNIYPEQVSPWLLNWMPDSGGYFVGNVQPAHMDFRFFMLGNLWAIISSLATKQQSEGILELIDSKWEDLIGHMPLKICFPALEGEEWRIITGADPKNTPWSYHNGGSWPVLLWQFTLACIKMGKPEMAERAVAVVEKRLGLDRWAEYYDTRSGRFIGKQARLHQTWSVAGYLSAKLLLANPEAACILTHEEDLGIMQASSCLIAANPRHKRRRTSPSPAHSPASPPY
eukprot:TRINITY_DN261_c0_g1_i1.p1 TRINITY_DN261_c0_g1~~TRINITY_DN261_c0_g1_i1.p1  ORF type:complete len:764 (+),score=92.99 TRINITY_DN261_c0_g1_i1:386-2677(+)